MFADDVMSLFSFKAVFAFSWVLVCSEHKTHTSKRLDVYSGGIFFLSIIAFAGTMWHRDGF